MHVLLTWPISNSPNEWVILNDSLGGHDTLIAGLSKVVISITYHNSPLFTFLRISQIANLKRAIPLL